MYALTDIERNFGSVAEYNRVQEEYNEHEYEKQLRQQDYYAKNRQLENEAIADSSFVFASWSCVSCPFYKYIGMTSEYDDIEHGRCCNLKKTDCAYRIEEKSK